MVDNTVLMVDFVIMFLIGFMVWIIFLRNFLLSWVRVKNPMSRYNVLVEVQHPVQNYFAPGQIEKNFLYYRGKSTKDNKKGNRIVDLTEIEKKVGIQAIVERKWGVMTIRVDDAKSSILYRDEDSYKSITGYSAEAIDDLVTDAQNRPSEEDGIMTPRVFQIIVVIGILILAIGLYMNYSNNNAKFATADIHNKMIYDQNVAILNHFNITIVPQNFTGIGG